MNLSKNRGHPEARTVFPDARMVAVVESPLRPVPDAPALLLEPVGKGFPRAIVIADLHLGLGSSSERPLGPPEGAADRLLEYLVDIARSTRAEAVIVAGDAKHPIVGTPPALRPVVFDFFAELLREGLAVELVLGNHDVGIVRHLPREVLVHPSTGVVRGKVGIFHGHRWPSKEVLEAPRLVAGHLHPGFRLAPTADDPEGKRRCWLRVERDVDSSQPPGKRRRTELGAREIVILPAFNPIAGTESLNRERPARGRSFLYRRFLADGAARAYLLDGTDLGGIPVISEADRPSRGEGRSPRGR